MRFCGGAEGRKGGMGGWEVILLGGKDSRHWVELPRLGKILPFALLLSALLARGLCFSGLISHWRPSKAQSGRVCSPPLAPASLYFDSVHFTSLHLTISSHFISPANAWSLCARCFSCFRN